MTTDLLVQQSSTKINFWETDTQVLSLSQKVWTAQEQEVSLPEVLFITSYPPRECGIATYSLDLINALNSQFESAFQCSICALESDSEQHTYAAQPQYILNTDQRNAFVKTAFRINCNKNIKLVVMQHEFGFFAAKADGYTRFLNTISKPVAFVFHTVLPQPDERLKNKVQEMSAMASAIIVMTNHAATILSEDYAVPAYKISVIPHGTHLMPPLERKKLKAKYHLTNKKVLSTFGLLSANKSIETTLFALPKVIEKHPDVVFLILGKTHPTVAKQEGEQYRTMLEKQVKALGLSKNVHFVNEYLPLPTLLNYLQLSDIYLFTSKDRHQAVSGTFSYAVSCGCPVISTPIPHAKEVLSHDNGIIIDFEDAAQLTKAILSLLDDPARRAQISSNSFHKMASTAWQNSAIAHALLFEKITNNAFPLQYKVPPINLEHVKKMTTDFGIIQFAKIAEPDLTTGYTLDDNARALIAICKHYTLFPNPTDLALMRTYFQFIKHCMQPDGQFLNYLNEQKEFTPQNLPENLEDSNGRAIWALGYIVSLKKIVPAHFSDEAEHLLQKALPNVEKIHSTRAMAFIIKGLYYQNKKENLPLLQTFADRLVQMYQHEKSRSWCWFESYLTYGNSVLPDAMLCAYLRTKNERYKKIAKESFDFLLSKIFVAGKIKVISNRGWLKKDKIATNVLGGEQAIDVAYTILALAKFYVVFNKEEYLQKADIAFSWFLGHNHLHQIIYNPCTGGCYDGLEEHNVNLNQGAESTLSYLLARLTVEQLGSMEKTMGFPIINTKIK